jgi:hypothetical protein
LRAWLSTLLLLPLAALSQPLAEPWHFADEFSSTGPERVEYLLGLGAYQKIRSRWQLKESEIVAGDLERITWQVHDGFTAEEGFDWYEENMPEGAERLFYCEGRACGSSAQWASRIFDERVLYGHDDRQRYAVWRMEEGGATWTVVLYATDRANRRHFLRLDRLQHTGTD